MDSWTAHKQLVDIHYYENCKKTMYLHFVINKTFVKHAQYGNLEKAWTLLARALFHYESKMNDKLWHYCQSGMTVLIKCLEEYQAIYYRTYNILCTQISLVNKCGRWHAIIRNQWSTAGIYTGVGCTYTEYKKRFLHRDVVDSSKVSANANLL